jgi:glycosyltransferase involved in cell wall biosynthesis
MFRRELRAVAQTRTVDVSVCILTKNEELNLPKCIQSIATDATQVVVIDDRSADQTREIAVGLGANVYEHEFADWASQRNWALDNVPFLTEWVLFLDADEEMTPTAWSELRKLLASAGEEVDGVAVRMELIFLGKTLRKAYHHPSITRCVRRSRVRWIGDGAREYALVPGKLLVLKSRLPHHDLRGLAYWLEKHIANSLREAQSKATRNKNLSLETIPRSQRIRLRLRLGLWEHLPASLTVPIYFVYRYVLCLGFLEGRAGFFLCFYHSCWYPVTIAALKREKTYCRTASTRSPECDCAEIDIGH